VSASGVGETYNRVEKREGKNRFLPRLRPVGLFPSPVALLITRPRTIRVYYYYYYYLPACCLPGPRVFLLLLCSVPYARDASVGRHARLTKRENDAVRRVGPFAYARAHPTPVAVASAADGPSNAVP